MFLEALTKQQAYADPAVEAPQNEALIAYLREQLTPRDLRMFGLEPLEDEVEPLALPASKVLSGLGASVSTALLFVVVGFFATLGLPEGSLVAATGGAVIA